MRAYGQGILPSSQIFFYTPQSNDMDTFLYPLCAGLYACDSDYVVDRMNYDSFLLMYVAKGNAFVTINGETNKIRTGNFALIDCYHPHKYGSIDNCELLWVHFDGALARNYFEYILGRHHSNLVIPADAAYACRYLDKLYQALCDQKPLEPATFSKYLLCTLTEFMRRPSVLTEEAVSDMERVRLYIDENLDKPINLDSIAAEANLSVYYFTRKFKKEFGVAPHEYLIQARLRTACFYLVSSSLFIKEIAYRCGFGNESNFCTCFKKNLGCTPAQYRADHLKT